MFPDDILVYDGIFCLISCCNAGLAGGTPPN
jgi:hypothetical protein